MILETLENLRREAYVRAVIRAAEFNNVAGYVGENLPLEIFYAASLTPYPIYGIDRGILNFSVEKNLCPLIDATVTYAKTDKCPLIHSSKLIIVGKICPAMTCELQKLKDKNIYVYSSEENLIAKIHEVYGVEIQEKTLCSVRSDLQKISDYLDALKRNFNLTDLQEFVIEYFINFLDLDERINFLEEISKSGALKNFHELNEFVNLIFKCSECRDKNLRREFFNGRLSFNVGIARNGCKNSRFTL